MLVSGDKINLHVATIFYQLLSSIGPVPKKLAPKSSLQGPLWPSSKMFWLKNTKIPFPCMLLSLICNVCQRLFHYPACVNLSVVLKKNQQKGICVLQLTILFEAT